MYRLFLRVSTMVRYNRGKGFAKERSVLCGRCKICKEYAKTAGGCGMGCGGRLAGRIYAAPRLSKNSLAPSGRGLRPQAVGERASRRHEGFGQRRGSLPPALRATAPPLAQAPPPPYRGSLSPRGRFFDTQRAAYMRPLLYTNFTQHLLSRGGVPGAHTL